LKELVERVVDELEMEMEIPGVGKIKAVFKLKKK
jgi:hypothetical protein